MTPDTHPRAQAPAKPPHPALLLALLAGLYFVPGLFFLGLTGERAAVAAPPSGGPEEVAVLASPDEPGEPLHVSGTVYAADGETPVPGAEIYVFHTDADGYYAPGTTDNSNPRLKATITTDENGRYAFRTIRPAPYPGSGVPAHVHYRVRRTPDAAPQSFELHFEGDPLLSERALERSRRAGRFGSVRPLERGDDSVWHAEYDLRLAPPRR